MIIPQIFAIFNPFTSGDLPTVISSMYRLIIIVSGVVVFVNIIIGGFLHLTSAGNVQKMRDGRDRISSSLIGLLIILSSWLIVYIINPQLVLLEIPEVDKDYDAIPEYGEPSAGETRLYQIPVGLLIDRSMLNEEGQEKMYNVRYTVNNIVDSVQELMDQAEELNELVQSADCGMSECAGSCTGTKCNGDDKKKEITELTETIKNETWPELRKLSEDDLTDAKIPVINDIFDLAIAGKMISLGGSHISPYNYIAEEKNSPAGDRKVTVLTHGDWPLNIFVKGVYSFLHNKTFPTHEDRFTFYFLYDQFSEAIDEISDVWDQSDLKKNYDALPADGYLTWPVEHPCMMVPGDFFGMRFHPLVKKDLFHQGIDIAKLIPPYGGNWANNSTKIYVIWGNGIKKATVVYSGWGGNWGYMVKIKYEGFHVVENGVKKPVELSVLYSHLNEASRLEVGDEVKAGDFVGMTGGTGRAEGIHLHFEIYINGKLVDPLLFLDLNEFDWIDEWKDKGWNTGTCYTKEQILQRGYNLPPEDEELKISGNWVVYPDMEIETSAELAGDRRIRPLYDAGSGKHLRPVPTKYIYDGISTKKQLKADRVATTKSGCKEATIARTEETHRYDYRIHDYFAGFIDELTDNVSHFNDILKKEGDLNQTHTGKYSHLNIDTGITWRCSASDFKILLFYRDLLWQSALWCDDPEFSALPGQSSHMTGRTFDFTIPSSTRCIAHPAVFKEIREIGKKYGFYATEYDTPDPDLCNRLKLANKTLGDCRTKVLWEWWHWEYNPPIKK